MMEDESPCEDEFMPAKPSETIRTFYTQPQFEEMYSRVLETKNQTFQQRSIAFTKQAGRKLKESYCGISAPKKRTQEDDIEFENRGADKSALKCKCGGIKCDLFCNFLLRIFPFINIMRGYDIKHSLANDLIAGFTIGVMHIPQGMAYSMLATLPPVYGLYCSMFAPFFYFFLGTSRHVSMGTIAIISLLTGGALDRAVANIPATSDKNPNGTFDLGKESSHVSRDLEISYRILMATALAMAVGITQLFMGVLRLGVLTRFLSDPMIAGFTVGSAVHVVFSQLTTILGLSIPKHTGIFNVPLKIYDICISLPKTNCVTLGLSLVCIAILYIFKLWINPPIMRKLKVPVPIELLIVIFGAVISHQLKLESQYGLNVVGTVPIGFPVPSIPNMTLINNLIGDVLIIALIAFSICYSLCSVYARQEGYDLDANQEMIAYGLTNIFSSFFHTFPLAGSLSRTAIQVTMKGSTQIVGLVAAIFVLFVILFAGHLFESVPNCCLSAIILVALQGMFMQMSQLPGLWRYSIWDFASWTITFLATVFLDVIYGLVLGILCSAMFVLIRAQLQKAVILGRLNNSEVFKQVDIYKDCEIDSDVKVVRYESDIFYAGADHFIEAVIDAVEFDPRPVKFKKVKYEKVLVRLNQKLSKQTSDEIELKDFIDDSFRMSPLLQDIPTDKSDANRDTWATYLTEESLNTNPIQVGEVTHRFCCPLIGRPTPVHELLSKRVQVMCQLNDLHESVPLTHIILDCSAWNFIDIVGIEALKSLLRDYKSIGIRVYLAACSKNIQNDFRKSTFYDEFDPSILFISVYDAFMWISNVDRKLIDSCQSNSTIIDPRASSSSCDL